MRVKGDVTPVTVKSEVPIGCAVAVFIGLWPATPESRSAVVGGASFRAGSRLALSSGIDSAFGHVHQKILSDVFLQVAWVRAEDQTILTLHSRVVTHNSRISVTHDNLRTWQLHIRQVKESDRGCYMCQINTSVMRIQEGCIDVHGE